MHARSIAADVLDALVQALEAESGGQPSAIEQQVREIRFQAERLRRTDGTRFARGSWIKSALGAVVAALERRAQPREQQPLAPWLASARSAIDALDGVTSLGFQRAATQDAFRSVADAVLAASQLRRSCL
jgi:hypothetical protein